jgi:hypothetical protein
MGLRAARPCLRPRAGAVFAAAGFAAPMTAPERMEGAAFSSPPRAIWTQKEVEDWEGLFTTRKKIS